MSNYIKLFLKLAFTVSLLTYFIVGINLNDILLKISFITINSWILLSVIAVLQNYFAAIRWWLILNLLKCDFNANPTLRIFFISQFLGQFMPTGAGSDAVRIYMLHRNGIGLARGVSSIIVDRYITTLTIIFLALLTMPVVIRLDPHNNELDTLYATLLTMFLILIVAIIVSGIIKNYALESKVFKKLILNLSQTYNILSSPRSLVLLTTLSAIVFFLMSNSMFIIANALDVNINYFDLLCVSFPIFLISAIPISIGGWGVREAAVISFLGLLNVSQSNSLTMSIVFGLIILAGTIPGVFIMGFKTTNSIIFPRVK